MEFLEKNYLQTSTQFAVNSNTLLAERVMDRDETRQWISQNYNDDSATSVMTISFDETMPVSRLALCAMNLKEFKMYYNGVTANTFAIQEGATTVTDFATNSETAMFFRTTEVQCTSITIEMKKTQLANSEKAIGYLYVGKDLVDFEKVPAASGYTPRLDSDEVVHKMSDGGIKINRKSIKRYADVKIKYVSREFREELRDIHDRDDSFVFVAFPTMTAWDEMIFPCVWEGDFDFYKHSDNSPAAGFEGMIRLRETPT